MPCSKISAALGVFVFPEIAVVAVSIGNFLYFVPLLTQYYKFFLRSFGCPLGLIEPSIGLPHILYSTRW